MAISSPRVSVSRNAKRAVNRAYARLVKPAERFLEIPTVPTQTKPRKLFDYARLLGARAKTNLSNYGKKPLAVVSETSVGDGRGNLLMAVFGSLEKKQSQGKIHGKIPLVGITGMGASGKTSTAKAMAKEFEKRTGKKALIISTDCYWLDNRSAELGGYDDPKNSDLKKLASDLQNLANVEEAEIPVFDIAQKKRIGTENIDPKKYGLIIVEGLFPNHPQVRKYLDVSVGVRRSLLDRYKRRLTRDPEERGKTEQQVREHYHRNEIVARLTVEPLTESSDIIFQRTQTPENWQIVKRPEVVSVLEKIRKAESVKLLSSLETEAENMIQTLRSEAKELRIQGMKRSAYNRIMAAQEIEGALMEKRGLGIIKREDGVYGLPEQVLRTKGNVTTHNGITYFRIGSSWITERQLKDPSDPNHQTYLAIIKAGKKQ